MIAKNRNRGLSLLLVGIPLLLLLVVLLFVFNGRTNTVEIIEEEDTVIKNPEITDLIKIAAEQVLVDEEAIGEYKIGNVEFSHMDEEDRQVFLLTYSMKPKDPANYILVGGGVKGEDGWINEKTKFVTVTEKSFIFSDSPS